MLLSAKIVLSVKARLQASSQSGDVLKDSSVHLGEVLVQFPAEMISDKFREVIRQPAKVRVSRYFCEREKSFIKSARPPPPSPVCDLLPLTTYRVFKGWLA